MQNTKDFFSFPRKFCIFAKEKIQLALVGKKFGERRNCFLIFLAGGKGIAPGA